MEARFGKVLHITPEEPDSCSGGKIAVMQTALSLAQTCERLDYVGPQIANSAARALYTNLYELEPSGNLALRVLDSLRMRTNRRYRSWLAANIDFASYDLVVLEFTKLHYVVERLPKGLPLAVRVHNVEADYTRNLWNKQKSPMSFVECMFAGRREQILLDRADEVLCLTTNDRDRLMELYGVPAQKTRILPICVEGRGQIRNHDAGDTVKLLVTGSLWYLPNEDGVLWFVRSVLSKLPAGFSLTVAGSRPTEKLKAELAKFENVTLCDSPKDMAPLFEEADVVVAPIFDGAGMKVKVAEALSYGKCVVGTPHAFIGYEVDSGRDAFVCDSAEEFAVALESYRTLSTDARAQFGARAMSLFDERYSMRSSAERWRGVLERHCAKGGRGE